MSEVHPGLLPLTSAQRGNPVLECIRNVGKEFGDILADYQVGRTTGVLFLRCVFCSLVSQRTSLYLASIASAYDTIGYIPNMSTNE